MEPNLTATCPSCQTQIRLKKKPFEGFFFFCDECDAELEVVQVNPLAVTEVIDEYEGFDDDDPEAYEYDDDDYSDEDYDDDDYDYDDDDYDDDDDDD